jgi:glycerol-3-phosphate acyltransferase PlsY
MNLILNLLLTLAAYLIGSIPFGLLIAKTKGVDIRKQGSGNIGATNVLRCLGKPLGITCFVLDVLKGYLPAALFPLVVQGSSSLGILFGGAAILGHNFPIYLKFKGGKGVATSAGVLLGVAPLAVLLGILTWAAVFFASGYVSLGSIIASVVVAVVGWIRIGTYGLTVAIALTLLGALAIWRHRANIKRLIEGTENKFERKRKESKVESEKSEDEG